MIRIKYMFLLVLSLLLTSCLRFPNTEKPHFICTLDKAVYRTSENIALSYTFDGVDVTDQLTEDGTCGIIFMYIEKYIPDSVGYFYEKKDFKIIDSGALKEIQYDDKLCYGYLFRDSYAKPINSNIIINIDEPGEYLLCVSCDIRYENIDGPIVLIAAPINFPFTVR